MLSHHQGPRPVSAAACWRCPVRRPDHDHRAGPARADSVRDAQTWVLNAINAPLAWKVTQGQGVTVAVIDSGVTRGVRPGRVGDHGPRPHRRRHPESNPGWGVHGTWMASLIAGHGHGGGSGIIGVAPRAHVLSIRVITDSSDPGFSPLRT